MISSARWTVFLVILLAGIAIATHLGLLPPVNGALERLAAQPAARDMFRDPIAGSSDAFVALVGFAIAIPVGLFLAIAVVVVIGGVAAGFIESVLRALKLPEWGSTPIVGVALLGAILATREAWLPYCMYAMGSVARAYVVWAGSRPPLVQ